jgi:hypothetical protein
VARRCARTTLEYNIKNSAENVSDERAIDAFAFGLHHSDLVEELRRIRHKTVSELMEVANRFADGEDAYHNKRARSLEHDRSSRYNNQRRRSRNEDNHISRNQVSAGYRRSDEEGDEHKNKGPNLGKLSCASYLCLIAVDFAGSHILSRIESPEAWILPGLNLVSGRCSAS